MDAKWNLVGCQYNILLRIYFVSSTFKIAGKKRKKNHIPSYIKNMIKKINGQKWTTQAWEPKTHQSNQSQWWKTYNWNQVKNCRTTLQGIHVIYVWQPSTRVIYRFPLPGYTYVTIARWVRAVSRRIIHDFWVGAMDLAFFVFIWLVYYSFREISNLLWQIKSNQIKPQ